MPRSNTQRTKRISVTDPLTGKRHQPRIYGKNAAELRDEEARVRAKILAGNYVEPERMTVADWCADWHTHYHRAGATQHARRTTIKHHIANDPIGAVQLGRLRRLHVQEWIDRKARTLARNTITGMVTTLRLALDRAVRLGVIPANPATGVDMPRTPRQAFTVWDESQVRTYLDAVADDPLSALWTLAVTLGLRRGELLALRWDDVDWQAGTLAVRRTITRGSDGRYTVGEIGKTAASSRTIPLGSVGMEALRVQRKRQLARRLENADVWTDSGAIFDDGWGLHHPNPHRIQYYHVRIMAAAGLPAIRIHDLRHTAATTMLRRGVPVTIVSRILGHANPSVTLGIYGHAISDYLTDATDAIDRLFGAS